MLLSGTATEWVCLEPSVPLVRRLKENLCRNGYSRCRIVNGFLDDLASEQQFNSIIYIDVLEHIEDDAAEMERASRLLKPGGHLVVLVPAHQWLYSPFDREIGHFRRYSAEDLLRRAPRDLYNERLVYLDSIGLVASCGNKLLLRQSMPSSRQIFFWDRVMVPVSRWVDPFLRNKFGKSLLAVWRKADR
jgi:SAM-dependent methyltransferase